MHNIFRFIIGLIVTLFVVVILAALLLALSPIIFGVTLTVWLLFVIGSIIYLVIVAFAFIWYFFRNKVKTKKTDKSFKFSIKQGKEV